MLSQDDDEQMALAASEQRAIVTVNFDDFMLLHEKYIAGGKDHWGIIFSTEERTSVLMQRLLRLLTSISGEDIKNQVRWLNEFK